MPYLATGLSLSVTVPLLRLCHDSWRLTMCCFGLLMLLIGALWFALRRRVHGGAPGADAAADAGGSLLRQVIRDRQVQLLAVADFCDMWGYNFLSAFLPTYFYTEAGMTLEQSSQLSAIFPVAGVAGALICGLWMSRLGLRKPFTWPMHLMIFAGTFLAVCGQGWLRVLGIVMCGFGNAGWSPALFTIPMEFPGMDARRTGVAYSFIFSMGYAAAFVSPLLGGWIGDHFSLKAALLIFSGFAMLAAVSTFLMRETGRRNRPQ